MEIRRDARGRTAIVRGDGETAGPVGQAGGHGAVEGALGVEVVGLDGEVGGEGAAGGGDEDDVREEEGVDGAVF